MVRAHKRRIRREIGDRYYYLNGKFFDRMSTSPRMVALALDAKIVRIEPYKDPIIGPTEYVYLESLSMPTFRPVPRGTRLMREIEEF